MQKGLFFAQNKKPFFLKVFTTYSHGHKLFDKFYRKLTKELVKKHLSMAVCNIGNFFLSCCNNIYCPNFNFRQFTDIGWASKRGENHCKSPFSFPLENCITVNAEPTFNEGHFVKTTSTSQKFCCL